MRDEIQALIGGYKVDIRILQRGSDPQAEVKIKTLQSVISDLKAALRN